MKKRGKITPFLVGVLDLAGDLDLDFILVALWLNKVGDSLEADLDLFSAEIINLL